MRFEADFILGIRKSSLFHIDFSRGRYNNIKKSALQYPKLNIFKKSEYGGARTEKYCERSARGR
jgi:hypothetical protein